MVITIDIGNTSIVFAAYIYNKLSFSFRLPTNTSKTEDEYAEVIIKHLRNSNLNPKEIVGIVIASVVPAIKDIFLRICRNHFNIKPLIVGESNLNVDLKININNTSSLGADRIANSVGAIAKYGHSLIVVDFGTATTFEVIDKNGFFIGGAIAPGIRSTIESLHEKTSALPLFTLKVPQSAIGKDTEECLNVGFFYGFIGMVKEIIATIHKEVDDTYTVIATGGFAELLKNHISCINIYDENLTIFGLYEIYSRSSKINNNK